MISNMPRARSVQRQLRRIGWGLAGTLVAGAPGLSLAQDAGNASIELETIVVTAQRRAERIEDVGISISTLSADQLTELNVRDVRDLAGQVPGMNIKPSLGDQNLIFTIRGVGLNSFFAANNPSTSIYVNQVPLSFHPMMAFQLFDVERVEVLKGPQGTLYGRNTTSGAVNFVTRRPTESLSGYLDVSYGRFADMRLEGAISGPLSETLTARVAATTRQRNSGWQFNRVENRELGEQDQLSGRALLDWMPSDALTVMLDIHGGRTRSDSLEYEHAGTRVGPGPAAPICAPMLAGIRAEGTCVSRFGYFDPDTNPYSGDYNDRNVVHVDAQGGSLTANWTAARVNTTAILGVESFERNFAFDGDGTPLSLSGNDFTDDIDTSYLEVRLASDESWGIDWIVGASYGKDEIGGDFRAIALDSFNTSISAIYQQDSENYAAFANIGVPLNSAVKLTAGLRYTEESRDYMNSTRDLAARGADTSLLIARGVCRPLSAPGVTPVVCSAEAGSFRDDDISGMIGLDIKPAEDLLVYGKLSKGFKSGGINAAINFGQVGTRPFKPETLYAGEIGFKGLLFDRRVRLNAAVYYYDWQDMQVFTQVQSGPLVSRVLSNAAEGEVMGIEADLTVQATADLSIGLSGNYNATEIKDYITAIPANDATGNEFANSPDFSGSGFIRHALPVGTGGLQLVTMLDANYRTEHYFEILNRPFFRENGYWLVNARVALGHESSGWEFAAWAKNILDERYRVDAIDFDGNNGLNLSAYGEPVTYGLSASYKF